MFSGKLIRTKILFFLALVVSFPDVLYATNNLAIAKRLGWVTQKNEYNICGGYYKELPIFYKPNPYVASQDGNYNISADETFLPLQQGTLKFKKNVEVTQLGRQLTSDCAYAYRNQKTGKIAKIDAMGNVHMREPGKLLAAKKATFDVKSKVVTLYDVYYRFIRDATKILTVKDPKTGKEEKRIYQLSAHGSAKQITRVKPTLTVLKSATYTTCQPGCDACWQMKGSTVKFDTASGRGQAWNTRLYIKKLPVFYVPFFSFPINNKRHTGFLMPSFRRTSRSGIIVATPFYLNIAPNYDAKITPNYMQQRGVFLQGLFRYLTPFNQGSANVGYIPTDRKFRWFQKDSVKTWASAPPKELHKLEEASDSRKSFAWQDNTTINEHWSSSINYNYVSDDYYVHDFSSNFIDSSENQLIRQAKLNYLGDIWSFSGNLQAYQTLHRVDAANVSNQYARLPQLQLNANFPQHPLGLYYGLNTEYARFSLHKNPYPDPNRILGINPRSSFRPFVSLPLNWPFAFLTPRVQLQLTKYHIESPLYNLTNTPSVAIPIVDVNGGLYFDRSVNIFQHAYQQTLEPVIYYLYVPYRKQNRIPVFDTGAQPFNYNFMFLDNRFTGIDRIGDANQVTLALITRFIDQDTGDEKANAKVGRIYYFSNRLVQLLYAPHHISDQAIKSEDKRPNSPIASSATYHFNQVWSATAGLNWNPLYNMFDNRSITFQYKTDARHIINIGYTYLRQGDKLPTALVKTDSPENDLKQTNISGYWQINNHWSIMGRWNYNWSHQHDQAFMYGVSYDSCCWAVRFIWARTFLSLDPNFHRDFDHVYYIEFALKGLGTFANNDPGSFLTSSIPGYADIFGQENRI